MKQRALNIFHLGIKEIWVTIRDPLMMFLILFAFSANIYSAYTTANNGLKNAAISIVDEDQSALSEHLISSFQTPYFNVPEMITREEIDGALDLGKHSFNLIIPAGFHKDILAKNKPELQLNVDATIIHQAFSGSMIIQQIISQELKTFFHGKIANSTPKITLNPQFMYNQNINLLWFKALIEVINMITVVCIILMGASIIREYERGTIEHLLAMPVKPIEIMCAKLWSMGLIVLIAAFFSVVMMIKLVLNIPIVGSLMLFVGYTVLYLFVAGSLGLFLATLSKTMPQFAMVLIVVIIPIQFLSGGVTPLQNMPAAIQNIMGLTPTAHYIEGAIAILFKDANLLEVGRNIVALLLIGFFLFAISLWQFRRALLKVS